LIRSTAREEGGPRSGAPIWAAPFVVLIGVWLWLAFSSGGYVARLWLAPALALGLFGLVVALCIAYPRRPRQLSLAVLAFFGAYSLWVALSALWAESTTRVWMESGRTFGYLLVLALALVFFTDPGARRVFRYLLIAGAFVLLIICIWRLWATDDLARLFFVKRLAYPTSYPNNAAALFLVAFWPLMWLAAGPEERAPVRGVALGVATGLLGLAIMTQSRGAIWSLAISLVLMFALSPHRLRLLFYLLVPALLMIYEFPSLNRYWLEGPEMVGGGPGARTLVVAAITAAFIGMILALLERWVRVSGRMKAIFGTIVLAVVVAGGIYGAVALTSDIGGPFSWVSQTWRQFTADAATGTVERSEAQGASRFTTVSSGGRVNIWKVAWRQFEASPVLGAGGDNFVFQYDRLRTLANYKPQQAHSIELQILGDTGVVGGIFAFGGILLALGGVLWPRCTAGWRGARETWLRRRKGPRDGETAGADPRMCNPRWGSDPKAYGWEMALLTGAAFWFIHASVDWLWQMPGVSIAALLLLAGAVAGVDARAGVMWPRLNRRRAREVPPAEDMPATQSAETETSHEDGLLVLRGRRSDQYAAKIRRRERKAMRKRRAAHLLQPPGPLSQGFRAGLGAVSLVVLLAAGLPFLSLQYQDSALALARTNGGRAAQRAATAHWFVPGDPGPYITQASIYASAAREALVSTGQDRAGAVLDDLALAIASFERAIALEPAGWSLHCQAGLATLDLLLAKQYAEGSTAPEENPGPATGSLQDWSGLAGLQQAIPGPGQAAESLATDPAARVAASRYRDLTRDELGDLARSFLGAADERNPLEAKVDETIQALEDILSH